MWRLCGKGKHHGGAENSGGVEKSAGLLSRLADCAHIVICERKQDYEQELLFLQEIIIENEGNTDLCKEVGRNVNKPCILGNVYGNDQEVLQSLSLLSLPTPLHSAAHKCCRNHRLER